MYRWHICPKKQTVFPKIVPIVLFRIGCFYSGMHFFEFFCTKPGLCQRLKAVDRAIEDVLWPNSLIVCLLFQRKVCCTVLATLEILNCTKERREWEPLVVPGYLRFKSYWMDRNLLYANGYVSTELPYYSFNIFRWKN